MDKDFWDTEDGKALVKKYEDMLKSSTFIFFEEDQYEYIIRHYLSLNKLKKALKVVEIAVQQFPYSSDLLLEKARILFESDKYHQALDILETLENLQPNDIEILLLKGAVLTNLEKYEDAIHCLESALDGNDDKD